jgi:hypothetical protein
VEVGEGAGICRMAEVQAAAWRLIRNQAMTQID